MKIGKFSKETGLSIDTLRYYDKIGMLTPKKENGVRRYQTEDLETVEVISRLKSCDFTLDEIKRVLSMEQIIEENQDPKALILLKSMFFEKQMDMGKKMEDITSAMTIISRAISKLDEVMDNEELIHKIMEDRK